MLVIPATILGAMTTASSSLSALVKNTPSLSYAAAGMSLVLTILTALHTSLNVSPPSILTRGACSSSFESVGKFAVSLSLHNLSRKHRAGRSSVPAN